MYVREPSFKISERIEFKDPMDPLFEPHKSGAITELWGLKAKRGFDFKEFI